jgi:hypothetical protein
VRQFRSHDDETLRKQAAIKDDEDKLIANTSLGATAEALLKQTRRANEDMESMTGRMRSAAFAMVVVVAGPAAAQAAGNLDQAAAQRFANLALQCVHLEYPNKLSHTLRGDADVRPPRELTPVFYGCYDWHSSVHGHWLLARLAKQFPGTCWRTAARASGENLTPAAVAAEVGYLQTRTLLRGRTAAWLLMLAAKCARGMTRMRAAGRRRWRHWRSRPRSDCAARPKLRYPIRVGEHSQTAFAFARPD